MKLQDCIYGTLVQKMDKLASQEIGMVVGITNRFNITKGTQLITERQNPINAIPLIQWQSGDLYPIHYDNIQRFFGHED